METNPTPSILDEDLSSVDTSMPVLREDIYLLEVTDAKEVPTNDGKGQMLTITLKTVEDGIATNGYAINKGFPVFARTSITPTEKYPKDRIRMEVAKICQAIGVKTIKPFADLKGKLVKVKIKVRPERTDPTTQATYPESNEIKQWIPAE